MNQITKYIFEQVANKSLSVIEAKEMLSELQKPGSFDDIAIIGLSCRFAGISDINSYWDKLINAESSIGELSQQRKMDMDNILSNPFNRILLHGYGVSDGTIPENLLGKGAFLDGIDVFDADFFGYSNKEATFMDPVHRILLECAYEAVEDAGYGGNSLRGTNAGVFVGKDHTELPMYKLVTESSSFHVTGSWAGILAGRISHFLGVSGPAMVIDTACSSGMTAIHQACLSLKNEECSIAIAGGINLELASLQHKYSENNNMDLVESPDWKVRSFDKKANGTLWGEGAGVVILKPMKAALADGDHIYAVIKGSAINNNGGTVAIATPNAEAQERVILEAWQSAGIDPETVSYIETHGSGTLVGDPTELKAISNAFEKYTKRKQFCGIGSVNGNIVHNVAASGVSSLLKVVLSLKHKMIPATLYFEEQNPHIDFCNSPIYMSDSNYAWDGGNPPRRAGVNAFGFSGTNLHFVLEEAPEHTEEVDLEGQPRIWVLSAKSEAALMRLIKRYEAFLSGTVPSVRDICYTASIGRGHYSYRLAFVVTDVEDLLSKITLCIENQLDNLPNNIYYQGPQTEYSGDKGDLVDQMHRILAKLITESADQSSLENLCRLYVCGADIDWNRLYQDNKGKRVNMPTYPFESTRHWAPTLQEPSGTNVEFSHSETENSSPDPQPKSTVQNRQHIAKLTLEILSQIIPQGANIAFDINLRELGVNSIQTMQLIVEMEQALYFTFPDEELTTENLSTIDRIIDIAWNQLVSS